jgi:NADPH:quinone reductase
MQAQIIDAFGGPELFRSATFPDPVPGPGQVLVRQEATSINIVDAKIRASGLGIAPPFPAVLGADVSGRVVAIGAGVTGFAPGDAVWGAAGGIVGHAGSYATLMLAEARLLAHRPAGLAAREAAALPLVGITALEGFDRAGLAVGQRVLVIGGSGGVGHVAVQVAKAKGAHVVATASGATKATAVSACGADAVVDLRATPVEQVVAEHAEGRGFDIVFDATGGADLGPAFAAARLNGQVVAIVSLFTQDLTQVHLKGLSLHLVFMLLPMLHGIDGDRHARMLDRLATLVGQGKLRPLIDPARFALEEVGAAQAHVESGRAIGKVVVDISG